jgi:hypothetical protein
LAKDLLLTAFGIRANNERAWRPFDARTARNLWSQVMAFEATTLEEAMAAR